MIPETRHSDQAAEAMPTREAAADGIHGALRALFPVPPEAGPSTWTRRILAAAVQIAAVCLGAVALLLRIPGLPSWDVVYAEDRWEFLAQAYQHPWHLYVAFGGYEQLLQRVVAQFVTYLPVADAAKAFASAGALIAAGCALFIFHASAGHIRSAPLRVLLAAAVVLLSSAPMEIADSTVNASFYLLLALFWAVLWRPRTRTGKAAAAVVAFVTAASTGIAILFAPLLAIRLIVLRRFSEHAVTAGWLAGCLVQLPLVLDTYFQGQSRLAGWGPSAGKNNRLGDSLTFYAHDVVLRAIGWHLSWRLEWLTGTDWATAIVAVALAVIFGVIMVTQAGTRPFVVVALLTGFVFSMVSTILTPWVAAWPVTIQKEPAARYTALPIFLIEAAVIVGVDYALRKRRGVRERHGLGRGYPQMALRPAVAVTALIAVLATSWAVDFRYKGIRAKSYSARWSVWVDEFRHECRDSPSGEIRMPISPGGILRKTTAKYLVIPCDRVRL
jgi:hypothetical protein